MSSNIFSVIKSRVSIVDVIGQYATLKRVGIYWKGRCPFHHEKTASFTVSPHIEIYYCFGCHESGDVIAFIAKIENCTQLEAAQQLAEQFGIELSSDEHKNQKKNNADYQSVCAFFANWCHRALKKHHIIQEYLSSRGISTASIDTFEIGYLPAGLASIKMLINDARSQANLLPHDLISAQLLSEGKSVLYSPFEDRIIFPIKDHLGRYCGFGGRTFKAIDERPKYYNSKENEYFSKGTLLFGLDRAKKSIQDTGEVFLVEGYIDCIAMVQNGYSNTVATLGTACTGQHLKILSRHAQTLTVVYDADNAGEQAILRLTQLCWQANMEPFVVKLPPGQDPASLIAHKQNIKDYLCAKEDIFVYFIRSISARFTTLSLAQKLQATSLLLNTIATVDDAMKQELLLSKASESFNIQIDILKKEFKKLLHDQKVQKSSLIDNSPDKKQITSSKKNLSIENKILCAVINNTKFLKNEPFSVILSYLPSTLRTLLLKLKKIGLETEGKIHFPTVFESLSQEEKELVSQVLFEYESTDQEDFDLLVAQFKKKWWKTITQTIKDSITHARRQGDHQKVNALLQDFVALQKTIVVETKKGS